MARLSFRCDEELVRRVDAERGLIPREAWLRRAVEQVLGGEQAARPENGSQAPNTAVRQQPPAPAEQPSEWPSDYEGQVAKIDGILKEATAAVSPVGRSRSSVQAKRDVRPIPKKGEK